MLKRPLILLLLLLQACGFGGLPGALERSIMNNPDPALVTSAVPAYLLMLDALVANDPEDADMNASAAKLYAFYATSLNSDPHSSALQAERGRRYGVEALCLKEERACGLATLPFEQYCGVLAGLDRAALPQLYAFSVSWLAWLQTHSSDMRALAELPRVERAFERILELEERWEDGAAHLYLGILLSLRPPALGGEPEKSRQHFERALEISAGKDLSYKVAFARYYARGVYDRELHDRLLREVLDSEPEETGRTLINALAKDEARQLLDSADGYF